MDLSNIRSEASDLGPKPNPSSENSFSSAVYLPWRRAFAEAARAQGSADIHRRWADRARTARQYSSAAFSGGAARKGAAKRCGGPRAGVPFTVGTRGQPLTVLEPKARALRYRLRRLRRP